MQRFVYVPKVEVFLRTDGDPANPNRVIDLTEDLIDGSVERKINQMSMATFTLQNKFGRYTGGAKGSGGPNAVRIRPMDRIIVRMSRVTDPFLVFSGYVDASPYYQLYPGPVTIQASCTLKLIQNTYFDPGLPYLTTYFNKFGWYYDFTTGALTTRNLTNGGFGYLDIAGGVGDVITHVLHDIGNWPLEAINVQALPDGFLDKISSAMFQQLTDVQKEDTKIKQRLETFLGTTGNATSNTNGSSTAGSGTTSTSTNPQTGNINFKQTAQYAKDAGFTGDALVTAVAIARAESSLSTDEMGYNTDGSYDVGLFQINTIHTPGGGGTGLPGPPSGHDHPIDNPKDFAAIKSSLPTNVATFMTNCCDPKFNAAQAYSISSNGTIFTPWVTFQKGLHLPYMADAKTAVDSLSDSSVTSDSTTSTQTNQSDPTTQRQATDGTDSKANTVATNAVKIAVAESKKGIHETGGQNQGPEILKYQQTTGAIGQAWCGSFATWVYLTAGLDIRPLYNNGTASVQNLMNVARSKGWVVSKPVGGDMICWDGPGTEDHVAVVTGTVGTTITYVAGNASDGVNAGSTTLNAVDGLGRIPVYIHTPGVGTAAADAASTGAGGGTDQTGTSTDGTTLDPVTAGLQAGFAVLQTQSTDSTLSMLLTGERAIANDISLLGWINQVVASSGRSFMSKPDGSFFAFFPDYFNNYTNTPYFNIADIELVDLTVYENDTDLVTHYFATGPITNGIHYAENAADLEFPMVASVEDGAFPLFINVDEGNPMGDKNDGSHFDVYAFLRRYGARPMNKDFPDVVHPVLLWLLVWREFTLQWAKRYTATCSTTFLPELFPGTVVGLGDHGGLTMYVNSVTHTFSREAGFSTTAELMSPATSTSANWTGLARSNPQLTPATQYSDYYGGPH